MRKMKLDFHPGHGHLNMLGRYSFAMPEEVKRGELRSLRDPENP